MKAKIHPKYNKTATITCTCGATYTVGSTVDTMATEICSKCHPFYTGEQKIVDTANLVKKFEKKQKAAQKKVRTKREKRARRSTKTQPKKPAESLTLKDMIKGLQKGK